MSENPHFCNMSYRGITLQWKEQIESVRKRITSMMPLLYRIKNSLTETMKKVIYNTLIESKLLYGIEIWGKAKSTEMEKIQKTQNKVIRLLYRNENNKEKKTKTIRIEKGILNCKENHIERLLKKRVGNN